MPSPPSGAEGSLKAFSPDFARYNEVFQLMDWL